MSTVQPEATPEQAEPTDVEQRPEPQTADEYIAQSRDVQQADLTRDLTTAYDAMVSAVLRMAEEAEGLTETDLRVMQALGESAYSIGVLAEHAVDGKLVDVTFRDDDLRDAFDRIMAAKGGGV